LVCGITDYAGRYGIATILELHATETIPAMESLVASDERFGISGSAAPTQAEGQDFSRLQRSQSDTRGGSR
jgi:hypothetical protein